jgi:hypothetical protein
MLGLLAFAQSHHPKICFPRKYGFPQQVRVSLGIYHMNNNEISSYWSLYMSFVVAIHGCITWDEQEMADRYIVLYLLFLKTWAAILTMALNSRHVLISVFAVLCATCCEVVKIGHAKTLILSWEALLILLEVCLSIAPMLLGWMTLRTLLEPSRFKQRGYSASSSSSDSESDHNSFSRDRRAQAIAKKITQRYRRR